MECESCMVYNEYSWDEILEWYEISLSYIEYCERLGKGSVRSVSHNDESGVGMMLAVR